MAKTDIDLIPSDAMARAAQQGLELADTESGAGIEPATKARARKIAEKKPLTPAVVKRMVKFFTSSTEEKDFNNPNQAVVNYLLWGGDAGKPWASSKIKALASTGANMTDDEETIEFAELFFADPAVAVDNDGLVWKPMLPQGVWKIGPNGKQLRVIAGKSPDQRKAIGMQDIVDAFNGGAVAHVTIPKTHDDRVDDNTGYVQKVAIRPYKGIPTLFGGHKFTDKVILGKVKEGSIANTSVGLEFDYQRKSDAKKFPIVLRHNALTNRPWLGSRLAPFGMSEEDGVFEVMSLEFDEPLTEGDETVDLWDGALTFDEIKDAINEQVECDVVDVALDRVLLKDGDDKYVARFSINDGDVEVDERSKWIETKVALDDISDDTSTDAEIADVLDSMSDSGSTVSGSSTTEDATTMAEEKTPKKDEPTPASGAPTQAQLSDDQIKQIQEPLKNENATLRASLDQLAAKDRKREADDIVTELKSLGFTETRGCTNFLKKCRAVMMSDTGETNLLLAEDEGEPRPITAAGLLRELIDTLPKGKDGKLTAQFAEQASDPLNRSADEKPDVETDDKQPTAEEKKAAADEFFAEHFPGAAPIPAAASNGDHKES